MVAAATARSPLERAPSALEVHRALVLKGTFSPLKLFDALPMFKPAASWAAWRAFLCAVYNHPMTEVELEIFRACTGRRWPPEEPVTEVYMPVGRRGGKSRIVSFMGAYEGAYRDYEPFLAPGERVSIPVLAADRDETRTILGYMAAILSTPGLAPLLEGAPKAGRIVLRNRVDIEVRTASFRANRGYTVGTALCDEIAFWRTGESSANPDFRILEALQPSMATIPNARLICLSSPYAQAGVLWEAFDQHYGKDHPGILVWKAATGWMNPSPQVAVIVAKAYQKDAVSAAAEYGAEFREDVLAYISRKTIKACTVVGRKALLPYALEVPEGQPKPTPVVYFAFIDTSGGSQDSMTLSIAHWEGPRGEASVGHAVQDVVKEWKAPFIPNRVVKAAADILKAFRLTTVKGDRYAGEWPRDRFAEHGITFLHSELSKSEIYRDVLPAFNSLQVELLDHEGMADQFTSLLRRVTPGGKDVIDHPPLGHDDLANSSAGALLDAYAVGMWSSARVPEEKPKTTVELMEQLYREMEQEANMRGRQSETPWVDQWEP